MSSWLWRHPAVQAMNLKLKKLPSKSLSYEFVSFIGQFGDSFHGDRWLAVGTQMMLLARIVASGISPTNGYCVFCTWGKFKISSCLCPTEVEKRKKRMHYQLGSCFVDWTFLTFVFLLYPWAHAVSKLYLWTHVGWVVANCFPKFRGSTPLSLRGYARRDWSCPSICDSHALHFLLGLLLPETYHSKTQKIQGVVALPRS